MRIEEIDRNFKLESIKEQNIRWYASSDVPFRTYGVFYSEEEECFRRLPKEVADATNQGVSDLARCTAGGRVRFITDSPYVAIRAVSPPEWVMNHMTVMGKAGISLHTEAEELCTCFSPDPTLHLGTGESYAFEGIYYTDGKEHLYTLSLPLYAGVKALFIGLAEGAVLKAPTPYSYDDKPVLFYGSSITQGGCASRPNSDYISLLSRWLDTDIRNLGFSGSARAEDAMIEYLCAQDPSVFVLDYDHNAPSVEHLEKTHEKLFLAFRRAHPETPVIMISKPDFRYDEESDRRRAVIATTYTNALARGDKSVAFIDGASFFRDHGRAACTVDCCHPTDLGFYMMAKGVFPVLKAFLEGKRP